MIRKASNGIKDKSREKNECFIIHGWVVGLIVSTIVVYVWVLCFGSCLKEFFCGVVRCLHGNADEIMRYMKKESAFFGSTVLSLATIMASFIVFYYNSIGHRNYGISNRKIIEYIYGTYFLPAVSGLNIIIIICFVYTYYARCYIAFYVFGGYSVAIQGFLIFNCVRSTSQRKAYKVLLSVERKQFQNICNAFEQRKGECEISFDYESEVERSTNLTVYHVDDVLKSDETLVEKYEMVQAIFSIPFSSPLLYKEYDQGTYYFLYFNMSIVAAHLSQHSEETQIVFSLLYENMDIMQKKYAESLNGWFYQNEVLKKEIAIYVSTLFHALIPQNITGKFEFFSYILNKVIQNKDLKDLLVVDYVGSIIILWFTCRISVKDCVDDLDYFFESISFQDKGNILNISEQMWPVFETWASISSMNNKWDILYVISGITSNNIDLELLSEMFDDEDEEFLLYLCQLIYR